MRGNIRWLWLVGVVAVLAVAPDVLAQPSPSPEAIRKKTTEVFERPEFKPRDSGASSWFLERLKAFFHWLGGLWDNAPVLFWFLLIVCIVALVGLLSLIGFQVRKVFTNSEGNRRAKAEGLARRRALSVTYREEAARYAALGEYTEAIRFLFLSLVYRLDERDRVSLHKAYTNREYLDLLGERLPARDALRIIVDTLDDHWYGQQPCQFPQYETCLGVYDRLVAAT
ncbi:MAG: DUF4129 domain-containing protein [Planctomycetes bacterium]|nr:DUF4129 domain-containing protein [Planctomycetota bacterium]